MKPKPARQRRIRQMALIVLALYLIAVMGCAVVQRRMICFPSHDSPEAFDQFAKSQGVERWKNSAGQNVGWKRSSPRQPPRGQILITHGNGGCAIDRFNFANSLRESATIDIFILEYPGFGDRAGSPSEKEFFMAADDAFKSLPKNVPTYLLGESLGTGVAAYLAGTYPNQVAGVVLFAPYNKLADVAQYHMPIFPVRWMMCDRFESEKYLHDYHGPVAVLVGGKDRVVPEKFGRRLFDGYAGPKRLWKFPEGSHQSIDSQPEEFWKELMNFWQTNQPALK